MNRFDAVKHLYYIGDRTLLSVTKWISRYTRPFNAPMVATMVAKKTNYARSQADVLNEWDLKRDIANNYGNAIHMAVEGWIKYRIIPTQRHLAECVEQFEKQFGRYNWVSEHRIFNEEYELGGTIDLLCEDKKIIADIKTNNTLQKKKKGNFLKPLNKLSVNNLNKVRLQTEVYNQLMGGRYKKLVYMWDGKKFHVIELEDVDITEILAERRAEVVQLKNGEQSTEN